MGRIKTSHLMSHETNIGTLSSCIINFSEALPAGAGHDGLHVRIWMSRDGRRTFRRFGQKLHIILWRIGLKIVQVNHDGLPTVSKDIHENIGGKF
jgi:hypothetical protein